MKLRIPVFVLVCFATSNLFAQSFGQQQQQPQPDQNGRYSVAIHPDVLQRLSEILGRPDRIEAGKIASEILRGNPNMGPGYGWYLPSQSRLNFEWLINKYDRTRNGKIVRSELPKYVTKNEFRILDRDRDGVVSKADMEWKKNPVMEDGPIQQAFNRLDQDSNGRLTRKEMDVFFERYSGGFDFLTPQDLERGLPIQPVRPRPTLQQQAKMDFSQVTPDKRLGLLEMLLSGALGSFEEGPDIGEDAPDFELPEMINDGDFYRLKLSGEKVKLSDSKGKRPAVLIFGSFT